MPADPINYTYAPGASLVVAGDSYPVAAFTLELAVTGIPKVVIQIDPFHIEGDAATPALAPNLGDLVASWKKLQDALYSDNRSVQLDFDAQRERSSNAPGNYDRLQEFSINGWIMTSAGMRNVGSRGGFAVVVEAVHPFHQFQESSAYLLSTGKEAKITPDAITGSATAGSSPNVFDALVSAMLAYYDVHAAADRIPEFDNSNYDAVVADYRSMIDFLEEYMQWDPDWEGEGIPCAQLWPADLKDYVLYSLIDYVRAASNSSSWDRFVHTICAHWFLALIPTFDEEKLRIRPLEPWSAHAMEIYDSDIVNIDLPAVDPTPIKGITGMFSGVSTNASVTFGLNAKGEQVANLEQVSVVEESLGGRIHVLQLPSWVSGTLNTAAAARAGEFLPTGEGEVTHATEQNSSSNSGEPQSEVDTEDFDGIITEVLPAVAKELFLENYRVHYQLSLTTRLLIKVDGAKTPNKYLMPGFVARLSPNPEISGESDPLLDFYVTKVVHSVNCQQGQASTQIIGSFVHQSDKPDLPNFDMTKGVASNAVYG